MCCVSNQQQGSISTCGCFGLVERASTPVQRHERLSPICTFCEWDVKMVCCMLPVQCRGSAAHPSKCVVKVNCRFAAMHVSRQFLTRRRACEATATRLCTGLCIGLLSCAEQHCSKNALHNRSCGDRAVHPCTSHTNFRTQIC